MKRDEEKQDTHRFAGNDCTISTVCVALMNCKIDHLWLSHEGSEVEKRHWHGSDSQRIRHRHQHLRAHHNGQLHIKMRYTHVNKSGDSNSCFCRWPGCHALISRPVPHLEVSDSGWRQYQPHSQCLVQPDVIRLQACLDAQLPEPRKSLKAASLQSGKSSEGAPAANQVKGRQASCLDLRRCIHDTDSRTHVRKPRYRCRTCALIRPASPLAKAEIRHVRRPDTKSLVA